MTLNPNCMKFWSEIYRMKVSKHKLKVNEENNCIIVDFAIPYDTRIEQKEKENVDKYQDLKRELQKLWDMRVKVVPIVTGALGTPPKEIKNKVEEQGIEVSFEEMQKTVLLQSARILRKVLEN